ncbi:MAG: cohesin domain-containing protein [Candidatus Hydrogenedentota bacterium]
MKKQISIAIAACMLFISFCVHAGTLRIGEPEVQGDQVTVPVLLEGEVADGVASLSFQLNYDPATVEPQLANPGAAAQSAGKNVTTNVKEPGTYMVVMSGLNTNTVASGEVTNIVLQRRSEEASTNISITGTTFASLEGDEIPSRGSTGNISFDTAGDEEEDTENQADTSDDDETAASDDTPEERSTTDPVSFDTTDSDTGRAANAAGSGQSDNALVGGGQASMAEAPDSEPDAEVGKGLAKALSAAAASRSSIGTRSSGTNEEGKDKGTDSPDRAAGAPDSEIQTAAITGETSPPETEAEREGHTEDAAVTPTETPAAPATTPSGEEPGAATGEPQTQEQETDAPPTQNTTRTLIFLIVVVAVVVCIVFFRRRLFS